MNTILPQILFGDCMTAASYWCSSKIGMTWWSICFAFDPGNGLRWAIPPFKYLLNSFMCNDFNTLSVKITFFGFCLTMLPIKGVWKCHKMLTGKKHKGENILDHVFVYLRALVLRSVKLVLISRRYSFMS